MPGHANSLNPQFRVIAVKVEDIGALDVATGMAADYVRRSGVGAAALALRVRLASDQACVGRGKATGPTSRNIRNCVGSFWQLAIQHPQATFLGRVLS